VVPLHKQILGNTHEICIETLCLQSSISANGGLVSSNPPRSRGYLHQSNLNHHPYEPSMVFFIAKDEPYLPRRRLGLN